MNNIEQLFDDLKSGHYEDIDIYLNKAIEEYNQMHSGLFRITLLNNDNWTLYDAKSIARESLKINA